MGSRRKPRKRSQRPRERSKSRDRSNPKTAEGRTERAYRVLRRAKPHFAIVQTQEQLFQVLVDALTGGTGNDYIATIFQGRMTTVAFARKVIAERWDDEQKVNDSIVRMVGIINQFRQKIEHDVISAGGTLFRNADLTAPRILIRPAQVGRKSE